MSLQFDTAPTTTRARVERMPQHRRNAPAAPENHVARLSDRRPGQATRMLTRLLWLLTACWGLAACAPQRDARSPAPATETPSIASSPTFPVAETDVVLGRGDAPVTIVAFLDLECPFCAQVHPTLRELQQRYGEDRLRLVIKHAPLPFHPRAVPAARAAQQVFEAKGGRVMLDYMGELFQNRDLRDATLARAALSQGVTLKNSPPIVAQLDAQIRTDLAYAERVGVSAVPAFFINGAPLLGAVPIEEFETLIEHELQAAAELEREGITKSQIFARRVDVNYAPPQSAEEAPEPAYRVPVAGAPAKGAQEAWVTLVEFVDFECTFCRRVHPVVEQLLREYPDKLRWVVRQQPLGFHQHAADAALLSLEVFRQRGSAAFFEAVEQLYAAPELGQQAFEAIAERFALDSAELQAAWAQGITDPRLVADLDLASDLEADGTPHFFINGRRLSGARPIEEFRAMIDEELERVGSFWPKANAAQRALGVYEALQQTALPPPGLTPLQAPALAADTPVVGDASARVTVQLFSDFECPYCRRVVATLRQLRERYPNDVRIAFRQLPLSFHRNARPAAEVALEVQRQLGDGAFWAFTDRVYGMGSAGLSGAPDVPNAPAALDPASLVAAAVAVGADPEQVKAALEQQRHRARIESDQRAAAQLGISGTPAVLVNGYLVVGAQPLRRFDRLVRHSLQQH